MQTYGHLDELIHFSQHEVAQLKDNKSIPHHVAIIMDGNRRWAKERAKNHPCNPLDGHWAGAEILFDIVEAAKELGIKILTVWAFSTENWNRSSIEINVMMHIFEKYLRENRKKMVEKGVKFAVIGELSSLSNCIKNEIITTIEATKEQNDIELIVAINYGGKDDLKRAFKKIVEKIERSELDKEAISEELIASHLDTSRWPDPDLLIRTSAEKRISNFMLWQLAYSEFYTTDVLWPDFRPIHLLKAVSSYQKRERRMGR